jgi:hypothetical protein
MFCRLEQKPQRLAGARFEVLHVGNSTELASEDRAEVPHWNATRKRIERPSLTKRAMAVIDAIQIFAALTNFSKRSYGRLSPLEVLRPRLRLTKIAREEATRFLLSPPDITFLLRLASSLGPKPPLTSSPIYLKLMTKQRSKQRSPTGARKRPRPKPCRLFT